MTDPVDAIETRGLTKRFGERNVVQDVDLRVPKGAIYGFLGLNGAGKTTTIRMLLGLIRPDAGVISIGGQPLVRSSLATIGSLVESPSLYSHLTARENLEIPRRQLDAPRARVAHVLTMVGLGEDGDRLVREYSLGMKQRLGLALALLNAPTLLLLDEPTNGLDPAGIQEMRILLRELVREHGVTVFLSSHLLAEVEQVADCVGIIHKGQMLFQGSLGALRAHQHQRLRIGVQHPEPASTYLRSLGHDVHDDGLGLLSLSGRGLEATVVNEALVRGGYEVFHVTLQQDSLEDLFFSLMRGAGR